MKINAGPESDDFEPWKSAKPLHNRQDPGLCKLASGSFTPLYPPSPPNMLKIQDWMISYFQDLEFKQWLGWSLDKFSSPKISPLQETLLNLQGPS